MLSCGREATGPGAAGARFARPISFRPVFPPILEQVGGAGSGVVAFTKVHIVLHRADGTVALDTVVNFPPGADSITVGLDVKLAPDAPATGELLSMNLGYVNAAGDTVFRGGPVTVDATPAVPGRPPPPPVQIPVSYTGPGAGAARVVIAQHALSANEGDAFTLTAVAQDAAGATVPGTPIIWTSLDPSIATINSPGSGAGSAQHVRGTARIVAQLLTGPSDQATVQVVLGAKRIAAQSGDGQKATVGAPLANPVVVQVTASDGVGVGGVPVTFAVATGGGSVGSASAVSDGSGFAQTTWRLGSAVGAQTLTASAAGLTGSPVSFSATGNAALPTKLVVTTQPTSTTAGTTLVAVSITAEDALNNTATAFTGQVTIALGPNAPNATLGGTTSVAAVAGVATFTTLWVNKSGLGYTLVATSAGLASATSAAFDIAAGAGRKLEFGTYPVGGVTAGVIVDAITVIARDSLGNLATSFTGSVTISTGVNPAGATFTGRATGTVALGVATFDSVRFQRAGSYRLAASAGGLTGITGPAFDVATASAARLAVASGGGQSGPGGSALPQPIVVQVTDAFGNPVVGAGTTVNFAVSTGGGTVTPSASVTNASGRASTSWKLGAVAGAQSIVATSVGLAAVSASATASGAGIPTGPTIGYAVEFPTSSNHFANFLLGSVITVTTPVTVTNLALIAKTAGPQVQMALYTDNAGQPGTLVVSSAITTMVVGPMELPVTPTALAPGNYWIMGIYNVTASIGIDYANTDVVKYIAFTFGTPLPTTFPGPTTYTGQRFNYYIRVQ